MPRLTAIAVLASLALAPVAAVAIPAAAHAETTHVTASHNVLRGWCAGTGYGGHFKRSCVLVADDDTGRLGFIDAAGHHHVYRDRAAAALRYVKAHSVPCREEDSASCYWDAATSGNGVGDSFLSVGQGHHRPATISLYLF